MYKKVISGILAITLTFGAAATTISESGAIFNHSIKANAASYDYDEEQAAQDGFKFDYTGESGTIAITGFTLSGTATVPSEITVSVGGNQTVTYPVTEIKSFGANENLKAVSIPSSIKKIDDNAFKGCTNLSSISLAEGVTYIGDNAFEGCFNNERMSGAVTLPETVTDIGEKAFANCTYLTEINIPRKVKKLGDNAFEGCTRLEKVTIGKGASHFGKNTFKDCKYLSSINLEDSDIQDVPESFFEGCKLLESVKLPATVKTVQKRAFAGCGFRELVLPDTLIEIEEEAYSDCSYLSKLEIPANVETIKDKAFYNCHSLKEVKIPYTVTNLNNNGKAFGWSDEGTTNGFVIAGCDEGNSVAFNYAKDNHFDFVVEHNYTNWKEQTPATCTSDGEQVGTCACGATTTAKIPAKGHQYSKAWTVDKAATTTSTGLKSHHCTVCGDKTSITVIPKKTSSSSSSSTTKKPSTSSSTTKKTSISKAKVSKISTKTYTGKQIKPAVKVVVGSKTLKKNTDYTVSYGKNKIGKASVTIKGKGKYTGTIKKYFYINPRKTSVSVNSPSRGRISVQTLKRAEASRYQVLISTNKNFKNAQSFTLNANKKNYVVNKIDVVVSSRRLYYVKARTIASGRYSSWSAVKAVRTK